MSSQPIRDPFADHLLTPQNSVFLLIDWQPTQISLVRSADQDLLLRNAVSTVRTVRRAGRPFDGERCVRTAAADDGGTRGAPA